MNIQIDRCMGCMNEKKYTGPCAVCGYDDDTPAPEGYLAPKTLLAERYIIGKLLSVGGEGAVYIAFDTAENRTVEIKEFIPDTLCRRAADGVSVEITEGSLPLFKSYLSEFADLHKTMINEIGSGCLKKEYGIFAAGNTGYVVTEHLEGMTFEESLAAHGGKMSWSELKNLLPPLFDTLSEMHEKGIVHRGISPSTLFVANDGRLVLTSVDISAARSAESQIKCDTYPGYSACEQYDLSERQGSWTDVYGLCAVIYKALTGTTPPDAETRKSVDRYVPPVDIDEDIPKYISDAVNDGLVLDCTKRIHNIPLLRTRLYTEPTAELPPEPEQSGTEDDGPVTPAAAIKFAPDDPDENERRTRRPEHSAAPAKKKKKKKKNEQKSSNVGTLIGIFIFFAMVAALVIAIIYFSEEAKNAGSDVTKPAQTTTAAETMPVTQRTRASTTETTQPQNAASTLSMPDLVNRFFNATLQSKFSMLVFEAEYDYSDDYAEGVIYEQDIPAGTSVTSGTTVTIKVSKGPATVELPDYTGMKLSDYADKLTQAGIKYTPEAMETDEVKSGYVVECSKGIGEKVYTSENEIITVYYAVKPAKTEPPETTGDEDDPDDEDIEQSGGRSEETEPRHTEPPEQEPQPDRSRQGQDDR